MSKGPEAPSRRNQAVRGGSITRRALLASGVHVAIAGPLVLSSYAALAQSGSPKYGGVLVQAMSADPTGANPSITTAIPDSTVGCLIYEGMTRIEEDFTPGPSLAKSWTISPDGLRYTFLLGDAKWQDGNEFTSKDVKYTLEEVSAKYSPKFHAAAELIKSIATPDPKTVIIELSKPFGPLLFSLSAYSGAAILPEHLFAGTNPLNNPTTLDRPVGTGPFILKQWLRGDRLVLEKNPNYWRPGRPYLDKIILQIIPDGNTRVLSLQSGEVDYTYFYFFPTDRIREAQQDPKLQLREKGVPEDKLLIWNVRRPPFNDPKVREALFRATDREYIKKVVYQNLGRVMTNHMDSRFSWAHDAAVDLGALYPFDLKKAAEMLDDAGLKPDQNGKRFDVRLAYISSDTDFGRLAQVLASLWQKIGVRVLDEGRPFNIDVEQVFTNWDFDATLQPYTTAGDPALGVARLYVTSAIQKRPFLNASGYSNAEVDSLFEAGAASSDFGERGRYYKKILPILARDLPVFPIWETASVNVASKRVHGKWAWSTGYSHWEDVWVEDGGAN